MKRLVICCDGTWNRLDAPHPTNVVKLAESVAHLDSAGTHQIVFYDEGVGTPTGTGGLLEKANKLAGGMFGAGLERNIEDAYRFLIFNYQPGDEIYIFGFSRGAYTARSLAGLIRNCGVLRRPDARCIGEAMDLYRSRAADAEPDAEASCRFRAARSPHVCVSDADRTWRKANEPGLAEAPDLRITYLGVWDTVGALGVPRHLWWARWLSGDSDFHDDKLSGMVMSARHGLAIDERRRAFEASPWDEGKLDRLNGAADRSDEGRPYQQLWFPGDHGSVGGGGDIVALSDDALDWIAAGAETMGLALYPEFRPALAPDFSGPLCNVSQKKGGFMDRLKKRDREGPERVLNVSEAAQKRWAEDTDYRPPSLARVADQLSAGAGSV